MKGIRNRLFIRLPLVALVLIALLTLTDGCARKEVEEIKIGAILPLTGGAGKYGVDAKNGIELAVFEKNKNGGINGSRVTVIYEDDQSTPSVAVSAFRKLLTSHDISVVIGGMTSSSALAIAPIAENSHVVLFSPSASTPKLTNAGAYIFRNELSDAFGGIAQADFTYNVLGITRTAILFINNDYGVGVVNAFIDRYTRLGGQIASKEAFEPDASDFRTHLSRIKYTSPEALLIVAYKEIIVILRQIRELGIDATLLSTPVFEDREVLSRAADLAENVIYVHYGGFPADASSPHISRFVKNYRATFKIEPGYYSALAYDAANIVLDAIQKAGSRADSIKEQLYRVEDFPGVTGNTTIDEKGDVIKPVTLKTVRNGAFVSYEEKSS